MQARCAEIRARQAGALQVGAEEVGGMRHTARALLLGAMAGTLAACSSGSSTSFSIFAEPGKYAYYSCQQIAGQIKNWTQRQQELKSLMERADQSAGGAAVSLIAYRADYVAAGEELDQLRASAHDKKCDQDAAWGSSTVIR
jgi:hypothetical protein